LPDGKESRQTATGGGWYARRAATSTVQNDRVLAIYRAQAMGSKCRCCGGSAQLANLFQTKDGRLNAIDAVTKAERAMNLPTFHGGCLDAS
jgi:hypothetical protein